MNAELSTSISETFMELAGESRFAILQMLEKQKWRSIQLAKELNLTIQPENWLGRHLSQPQRAISTRDVKREPQAVRLGGCMAWDRIGMAYWLESGMPICAICAGCAGCVRVLRCVWVPCELVGSHMNV